MKRLPETEHSLVVRTDYSDDAAWAEVADAIGRPLGGFKACVDLVSDTAYAGVTPEQLRSVVAESSHRSFMFVVDGVALSHREHPILVLDLHEQPGRTFRVIPSEAWGVENNLCLANMDSPEFADAVDPDGIFRGFRE